MSERLDFDLHEFLPYLLNQAAEASSRAFAKIYKSRYGMQRTEWRVLVHLGQYGALTASEICQRAHLHKTKVSRAVFALESRKFLERERDPNDRRREKLTLTRQGTKVFEELAIAAKEHNTALHAQLGPELATNLEAALKRLI